MADSLELWRRQGASFTHRGHDIFVRRGGDPRAPVLVLIHGFPTASWDFAPLWDALVARWRVLTLDMLGFGLSAKPPGYRLFDRRPGRPDPGASCRRRESRSITSWPTTTATPWPRNSWPGAAAEPALRSVCLLNGGIFPEAHRPLLIQRLLSSPAGPLVARLSTRTTFAASMRRIFGPDRPPTPAELDGWWALVTHGNGRAALAGVSRYRQERRRLRTRWVGALQTTPVPLRLIVGTADPIAGAGIAGRYRQLVPRADVIELTGVGHYPQVEAPDLVLAAYAEFRAGLA